MIEVQHLFVRRLGGKDFPVEDYARVAAFAAAIRNLAHSYFTYEIVTDFFPRPEWNDEATN